MLKLGACPLSTHDHVGRVKGNFILMNVVEPPVAPITQLLRTAYEGSQPEPRVLDSIFTLLYDDLHRIAHSKLRQHRYNPLVDPTTVLHESYLRLAKLGKLTFVDRRHFCAYAARVMRSVVVDIARSARAECRGGESLHVTLDTAMAGSSIENEVLNVHDALQQLELVEPRMVRVVEARYFVGLSDVEISKMLGVTERTIRRDMEKAKLLIAQLIRES